MVSSIKIDRINCRDTCRTFPSLSGATHADRSIYAPTSQKSSGSSLAIQNPAFYTLPHIYKYHLS